MELRNVKTFIKIAEIGNFSRAASDLGYAQSTVTMQIQTLERELGVSLFERNGKSAVLSAAGKEFLDYAYDLPYQQIINSIIRGNLTDAIRRFTWYAVRDHTRFIHINLSSQEKMCGMRWQIDISAMKFSRYTASFLVIYIIS